MGRIREYAFLGVAIALIITGMGFFGWQRTFRLERELEETKAALEQMHIEHRDTIDAICSALDAREEISRQAGRARERFGQVMDGDSPADIPGDRRKAVEQ